MSLRAPASSPDLSENNVRFLGKISGLAPDEADWEDDDSDWEARIPEDDELGDEVDDADEDLDWWLEDETEDELPLPGDWCPEEDDDRNGN